MKVIKHNDGTMSLRCSEDLFWFVISAFKEIKDEKYVAKSYIEAIIKRLEEKLES